MKKGRWYPAVGLAVATALLVSASALVSADRQVVWGHTEGLTQEEILEKLYALSPADFKADVDEALEETAETGQADKDLICWIGAVSKRIGDYTEEELVQRIVENQSSLELCQLWINYYGVRYPDRDHNDPRLLALLQDEGFSPGLKCSLISTLGFEKEKELDILRELCEAEDSALRFNAKSRLSQVDRGIAVEEAEQTLEGQVEDAGQTESAIDILAQEIAKNGGSRAEKDELIARCADLLNTETDQTVKDSLVYDMQMLGDMEALRMVVQHPKVDAVMKKGMIDNNYYLLEEALLNDPTPQDVEFAVTCMELLPIKDLYTPLKTAMAAMPQTRGADGADWEALLQTMQEEGVEAKTWLKEDR